VAAASGVQLLGLKESGVDFVAADMPNANRLTVEIMAMIPTARGGEWSSPQVMRILKRLELLREEEAMAA
jgi:hypothetical protein